jgi:hypothetical protein
MVSPVSQYLCALILFNPFQIDLYWKICSTFDQLLSLCLSSTVIKAIKNIIPIKLLMKFDVWKGLICYKSN